MDRKKVDVLIINDDDLECNKEKYTLDDIELSKVAFRAVDMAKYSVIVYKGKLGKKVLRMTV